MILIYETDYHCFHYVHIGDTNFKKSDFPMSEEITMCYTNIHERKFQKQSNFKIKKKSSEMKLYNSSFSFGVIIYEKKIQFKINVNY